MSATVAAVLETAYPFDLEGDIVTVSISRVLIYLLDEPK